MKVRITTAVAVVAILAGALAAVAGAATESTMKGTMTSFSYDAAKDTGKLHIVSSKGVKTTIALNGKTGCGVSFGQSGDEVDCKAFTGSKYRGKPFMVTAKKYSDGHRVASIVAADLSK